MIKLISECHDFLKGCGFTYAFCGGHALELYTNKRIRPHSDIDISIFDEDRKNIVEFMLNKGWKVYEHPPYKKCLGLISNPNDERVLNRHCVWAIKPDCSFLKIKQKPGEENFFDFEILNKEQLNLDFIEIVFNKQRNGKFICDNDKNISREFDKAILYNEGIPYLAPELMLFIISNPVYMDSDYHREKNQVDFNSTVTFLPKENKDWLINALEIAYPEGNKRLDELKK
jgi:hypothetical protein